MSDFKNTIKTYLDKRASEDELFAKSYAKENKSIDECCQYITGEAKKKAKNGCAAIDDATVFGWAVHYYDEDSIKINKNVPKAAVSVPKTEKSVPKVELTEEDKAKAKEIAMQRAIEEQREAMRKKPAKKRVETDVQPSLFDF